MSSLAVAQIDIVYPRPMGNLDERQNYAIELLGLALAKSGKGYRLQPSKSVQKQKRALKNMELGSGIDVVWTVTSAEREKFLRPIRIPIDKGLVGWRIPLIREVDVERFERLHDLKGLQALNAGQGHDWPDVAVLQHNGFKTTNLPSYVGMFKMLASGRVDYFPRSVLEIESESETHANKNLVVDPNLLLVYPSALYFFVSFDAPTLADDIQKGLEEMIASGDFDLLFNRYFSEPIERLNLRSRHVFYLENPFLPKKTPLSKRELWFEAPPRSNQ